jgi:hypothetical protein
MFCHHFPSVVITASLRGGIWGHNTSLTAPSIIEVPVPTRESEQSRVLALSFYYFLRFFNLILYLFRQRGILFFFIFFSYFFAFYSFSWKTY